MRRYIDGYKTVVRSERVDGPAANDGCCAAARGRLTTDTAVELCISTVVAWRVEEIDDLPFIPLFLNSMMSTQCLDGRRSTV